MAAHMEHGEVQKLPVVPYTEVRKNLRSGDLFFCSGDYLISQAIQKLTNSPWSHVGIVFHLAGIDRVLLLESVEDSGVRFVPLSKYLNNYDQGRSYSGCAVLGRCRNADSGVVAALAKFGIDLLTLPYDKEEIAKILVRISLGYGKKEGDREYICSELVYECFSKAGIEFRYDKRGFISPENIWVDERVSFIGRIL